MVLGSCQQLMFLHIVLHYTLEQHEQIVIWCQNEMLSNSVGATTFNGLPKICISV